MSGRHPPVRIPGRTELLAAVFCPDCGTEFALAPEAELGDCPECGSKVHSGTCSIDSQANLQTLSSTAHWKGIRAADAHELDELIGQSLGVYYFQAFLGAGAMGRVYLARHRDLQRACALKLLPSQLVDYDPQFVNRFLEEGRSAAALVHPNIVTVHAIGELAGHYFLEMEFVPGQSLRSKLQEEGPLNPERATSIVLKMADGLAAAHRAGFLHRDLKPDNVLLTHRAIPKIVDFGLAQHVVVSDNLEAQRELVGTPAYMAPELFSGHPAGPAADVWALGVCYYELLTGQQPFSGQTIAELRKAHDRDPLDHLRREHPQISLEFAECLSLLLAKAPENRPADGFAASLLLQAVLGQTVDLETLLVDAFEHHSGVKWTRFGERYRVELTFPNGRCQKCDIERSDHAAADRLLCISSICCDADPNYFETALRLNAEVLHGGLAIREIDGRTVFVMLDNYPLATVDPEEVRRSVLDVAHHADAIEKLLTGGRDSH